MKPTVILDANALHGRKPFTRTDSMVLLELARTGRIRLVLPDVVLHELSRQWAERLDDNRSRFGAALRELNGTLGEVGAPALFLEPPTLERAVFYDAAVALVRSKHVETPPCPDVSISDLLRRDIAVRKPFDRDGKGFRDALLWETVRTVCSELNGTDASIIFVTNNHKDFCVSEEDRTLHSDLQRELPEGRQLEVASFLKDVLAHDSIKPLAGLLRVLEATFTLDRVTKLVDDALVSIQGYDIVSVVDDYDEDANPFLTPLSDIAFNEIMFDGGTIEHEVYRTGEIDEMTIRVTVDADCVFEGFADKSLWGYNGFTYTEDWNRHTIRAMEPRRVRFTLSADFLESTIDGVVLSVDEIEEV